MDTLWGPRAGPEIRFELRLGHRGGETRQARAGQANDDSDVGARSDDEETAATAQQSQDRASNHPKRAAQTKAARQTTNSQ